MNNLIKKFTVLNEVYKSMKKNYDTLEKMFANHSSIKQKVILSEQILDQAYILIKEGFEETEERRQFNRIIKDIKKK